MHFPDDSTDRVSLRNYDGSRPVNTPTSLLACRMEGVLPKQLVRQEPPARDTMREQEPQSGAGGGASGAAAKDSKASLEAEKAAVRFRVLERERKALLQVVKGRYDAIVAGGGASTGPSKTGASGGDATTTAAAGASSATAAPPGGADTGPNTGTAPLGGTPRGASPSRRRANSDDDATEAAHYFLLLKQAAETQSRQQQKWKEKERRIAELNEKLAQARRERAEKSSAEFEKRLEKAKKAHEAHEATVQSRTRQKMATLDDKIRQADSNKKKLLPKGDTTHGAAELEAAQRKREEQLKRLHEKIERANEASKAIHAKLEHDRALKLYEAELVATLQEHQAERHRRAAEFKREEIAKRVDEDRRLAAQREAEREAEEKARALRAERIAREKEEIAAYVEQHKGEIEVRPPRWLEDRLRALEAKKHSRRSAAPATGAAATTTSASAAGDDGGGSPRGFAAKSARGSRVTSFGDVASESDRPGTYTPRPPKERFSIGAPRLSERQAFPKWMFEE